MRRQAVEKVHSSLRIADMAFDINLLYSLKRAGYHIREVPTEWTDKIGTKVKLFGTSLVMFLSVIRIRPIYWPRLYPGRRRAVQGPRSGLAHKVTAAAFQHVQILDAAPPPQSDLAVALTPLS